MKVLVLGATGFVGAWVVKKLGQFEQDATVEKTSLSLGTDLRDWGQTLALFKRTRPDYVVNCSAFVGGIQYGYKYPADLFTHNLRMIVNIFDACRETGVRRLVQPISNCAYPARETYFQEESFWNGQLHESVLVYGMTRKMMWTGAWAYDKQHGLDTISLVVSNMYGPGDHFQAERSHALGAMVKRIVDAKEEGRKRVVIWGSGTPVREWLYVEDGAEALVRALHIAPHNDIINVGTGQGISVRDLAFKIREVVGWDGDFDFDTSQPDGAPHKTVDGSKGEGLLSWKPSTGLREGIRETVAYYMEYRKEHMNS